MVSKDPWGLNFQLTKAYRPELDSLRRLAQQQARLKAFVDKHCNQSPLDNTVETMESILARLEALVHSDPAAKQNRSA